LAARLSGGQKGDFVTMHNAIGNALEAVPVIAKLMADAKQRDRERRAQATIEERRRRARERVEAWERARQAAKEELRSIVTLSSSTNILSGRDARNPPFAGGGCSTGAAGARIRAGRL
jgi:hypothetical protein